MKNRIRLFLNTSYPVTFGNNWKSALFAAIFITFFITFFEPFNLSRISNPHKKLILSGYGLITLVVLMIDTVILPLLIKHVFNEKKWTNGKQIVFLLWIFFTIGLGNYLYSSYVFSFDLLNLRFFLTFELLTLAVGIIPAIIILLWKNNAYLKQNLKSAQELSNTLQDNQDSSRQQTILHIFESHNGKDSIKLPENDILFIESEGNYCYIYYLDNGSLKRKVLRTTLKNIEENIPDESFLFKSHRAFIVNPKQIQKINGNAQGYRLRFNNTTKEASVSRQYINDFKSLIQQLG
ncbi:MAG: LytTR family transcriptional regulator [Chlorobi bacterium]|nr:LytTR family transcriptional regulator [Chlorobiota bacterium]